MLYVFGAAGYIVYGILELFAAVIGRLLYYALHFIVFFRLPENMWVYKRWNTYELGLNAYTETRIYPTLWSWLFHTSRYKSTFTAHHINKFDID